MAVGLLPQSMVDRGLRGIGLVPAGGDRSIKTRPGQLPPANVINDGNDSSGLLHLPGATWVGPAVTNLCTNGGFEVDASGWTGVSASVAQISTDGAIGSGCLEVTSAGGSAQCEFQSFVTAAPVAQTPYAEGIFIKGIAGTVGLTAHLRIREKGGASGTASTFDVTVVLTAAWQKITGTGTPIQADRTSLDCNIFVAGTANGDKYRVDGVMVETGSVSNPYTATSRSAGRVQMPWDAGLFTAQQGWFATLVRLGYPSTDTAYHSFFTWYDSGSVRLAGYLNASQAIAGSRNGSDASAITLGAFSTGAVFLLLFEWTATQVLVSFNGGAPTASAIAAGAAPTSTTFDIGTYNLGTQFWLAGDVLWSAVGNGLHNTSSRAALAASFGTAAKPDPTIRALDNVARGAHAMAVWDGRTGTFDRRIAS